MAALSYLFSPIGRFRRLDWHFLWMVFFFLGILFSLVCAVMGVEKNLAIPNPAELIPTDGLAIAFPPAAKTNFAEILFGLISTISLYCATVKRFHDLGQSGWNALHIFLPLHIFGGIALCAYLGFIPGMIGVLILGAVIVIFLTIKLGFVEGLLQENAYGPPLYSNLTVRQFFTTAAVLAGLCIALAVTVAPKNETDQPLMTGLESISGLPKTENTFEAETLKKSLSNLRARAEAGHPETQYKLAFIYASPERALYWLHRAAEQGYLVAQYNLGIFYTTGQYGTKLDPQKGYFWLTHAAFAGFDSGDKTNYRAIAQQSFPLAPCARSNKRRKNGKQRRRINKRRLMA
jgi:uncharacterized membrane protein YhaH (DUF805 family)